MRAVPARWQAALGLLLVLGLARCGTSTFRADRMNLTAGQWSGLLARYGLDPAGIPNPVEADAEVRKAAAGFAGAGTPKEKLERLQKALFDERHFTFDYDAKSTFTAREAFARRRGNCVAFTNLFIAMARAVQIPVQAGFLRRMTRSERQGNLVVVSTHLVAIHRYGAKELTVYDFYRTSEGPNGDVRPIDDVWLAAIYLNNRGVDELREEAFDAALRDFKATVVLAPDFGPAFGNLGVLLRRRGDVDGAFAAYRRALEIEPNDPNVLTNLASLYESQGNTAAARTALSAADLRAATPYTLIVRGDLELTDGRTEQALRLFGRAHRKAPRDPEPLIAVARAELVRGRRDAAKKALQKALAAAPESVEAKRLLAGL